MTRSQIIEVMARAMCIEEGGQPEKYPYDVEPYLSTAEAALTALESSGYIVRPREATDSMLRGVEPTTAVYDERIRELDTAMTEAWLKEMNRD